MSRALKITFATVVIALALVGWQCSARAQQPPEDGRIAVYRQLLTQANDNAAALGAQLQAAQIENAQLKAQIEKRKSEDNAAKGPIQSDGKPMPPPMPLDKKP